MEEKQYRTGVGACIFNNEQKVFVAQRLDITDAWQLVQGGIDEGESPQDALFRELIEETGIAKKHLKILYQSQDWISYDFPAEKSFFNGKFKGQKQIWFALHFSGKESDINLNYTSHPEFSNFKWIDLHEIIDLAVDFKQDLYQKIINEFNHIVSKRK